MNKIYQKSFLGGKNVGFTLIELLVVVLIIGILAVVAVSQYQKVVFKSRASEALILFKSLTQAADAYYISNGSFPGDINDLDITLPVSEELERNKTSAFCWEGEWPVGSGARTSYCAVSFFGSSVDYVRLIYSPTQKYCAARFQSKLGNNFCRSVGKADNVGGGDWNSYIMQ